MTKTIPRSNYRFFFALMSHKTHFPVFSSIDVIQSNFSRINCNILSFIQFECLIEHSLWKMMKEKSELSILGFGAFSVFVKLLLLYSDKINECIVLGCLCCWLMFFSCDDCLWSVFCVGYVYFVWVQMM